MKKLALFERVTRLHFKFLKTPVLRISSKRSNHLFVDFPCGPRVKDAVCLLSSFHYTALSNSSLLDRSALSDPTQLYKIDVLVKGANDRPCL